MTKTTNDPVIERPTSFATHLQVCKFNHDNWLMAMAQANPLAPNPSR